MGNVGGKLLEQINQQRDYLLENLRLKVRVISLSNSRKMILADTPIELDQWKENLKNSSLKADRQIFFDHIKKLNLRNSIFVDNTANEGIAA